MNTYFVNYWADFFQIWYSYRVAYMEEIQYVNLIEIAPVVIDIQGIEKQRVSGSCNNTCVPHGFLGC